MPIKVAQLLQTKLQRPGVTRDLVPRPRLIERLNRGLSGPLTLVSASAGYGKSTLVSSWLEGVAAAGAGTATPPLSAAWLSLDEFDSDLAQFLRYFIVALRTIIPEACPESTRMLAAPQRAPVQILTASVINELVLLPGRLILVLDDYHTIHGEAVHDFLNSLVRHWPPPLHMVLISRLNPPLPLASLRANGLLTEIRTRDLRFTRDETAEYLGRVLPALPSESAVDLLEERTEGWIAGLHLATLSLRTGADPGDVANLLSEADADIAEYLVDEVLSQQPPAIQTFLRQTAILDRFCSSLCQAVVGSASEAAYDACACIDWLARANLFITPLDNQGEWYRYHHSFQELLQRRLFAETDHDQVTELHCNAASWFAEQGLIDEALRHAVAAHDLDLAARLVSEGLPGALNREDRLMLERWLRLLPQEIVELRPATLILKAWTLHFSWQMGASAKVLDQLEQLMGRDGSAPECLDGSPDLSLLRGQVALMRGQQAYNRNEPEGARAFCEETLALLPSSWKYARGGAKFYWAMAMRTLGRSEAAQTALLDEYESLGEKADGYALRLLNAACYNYVETGQLEQARQTAELMLERATRSQLSLLEGWGHNWLGLADYYRNDLDTAALHLRALVEKPYVFHTLTVRNAMRTLTLVEVARGETGEAWETMELLARYDMARVAQEPDDTRSLRARLHLLSGDIENAFGWADRYLAPVPDAPVTWLQDPHLMKARVLLARGGGADAQSALDSLDALYEIGVRTYNTRVQIELLPLRALALSTLGRASDAQGELRRAVELAQPGGFVRPFVDLGPRMKDMLIHLEAQGLASQAVRRIRAAFPQEEAAAPTFPESAVRNPSPQLIEPLTSREIDVLLLLRERLSNKEIAGKLYVSTQTVKRHTVNIYGKLGVNRRWDAVTKAENLGILPRR